MRTISVHGGNRQFKWKIPQFTQKKNSSYVEGSEKTLLIFFFQICSLSRESSLHYFSVWAPFLLYICNWRLKKTLYNRINHMCCSSSYTLWFYWGLYKKKHGNITKIVVNFYVRSFSLYCLLYKQLCAKKYKNTASQNSCILVLSCIVNFLYAVLNKTWYKGYKHEK